MSPQLPVIVGLSVPKQLRSVLLANVVGIGGMLMMVGTGTIFTVAAGAFVGLSLVVLMVSLSRQRPRVIITPQGFEVQRVFGVRSYQWADIEGDFAIIKTGWTKLVGFHLTAAYKARVGKKPTKLFSGYDDAITGAFQVSAEKLADLLNAHRQQFLATSEHRQH